MERSYPKRNRQSTGTSGGASAGNAPKRPRRSAGDVAGFGDGLPLPGSDNPAWRPSSSSSSGGERCRRWRRGGRRIVVVVVVVKVGQGLQAPDVPPRQAVLRERADSKLLRSDVG